MPTTTLTGATGPILTLNGPVIAGSTRGLDLASDQSFWLSKDVFVNRLVLGRGRGKEEHHISETWPAFPAQLQTWSKAVYDVSGC